MTAVFSEILKRVSIDRIGEDLFITEHYMTLVKITECVNPPTQQRVTIIVLSVCLSVGKIPANLRILAL